MYMNCNASAIRSALSSLKGEEFIVSYVIFDDSEIGFFAENGFVFV